MDHLTHRKAFIDHMDSGVRQEKVFCSNRGEVPKTMIVLLCLASRFPDVQYNFISRPLATYIFFKQRKHERV